MKNEQQKAKMDVVSLSSFIETLKILSTKENSDKIQQSKQLTNNSKKYMS